MSTNSSLGMALPSISTFSAAAPCMARVDRCMSGGKELRIQFSGKRRLEVNISNYYTTSARLVGDIKGVQVGLFIRKSRIELVNNTYSYIAVSALLLSVKI